MVVAVPAEAAGGGGGGADGTPAVTVLIKSFDGNVTCIENLRIYIDHNI